MLQVVVVIRLGLPQVCATQIIRCIVPQLVIALPRRRLHLRQCLCQRLLQYHLRLPLHLPNVATATLVMLQVVVVIRLGLPQVCATQIIRCIVPQMVIALPRRRLHLRQCLCHHLLQPHHPCQSPHQFQPLLLWRSLVIGTQHGNP